MKICKVEKKREVVDIDYEVCGDNYCCDKMRQWLRIGTRSRNHLRYSLDTEKFEIEVREDSGCNYNLDESGSNRAAYEELNFCPFCGANVYNASNGRKVAPGSWSRTIKGSPDPDLEMHLYFVYDPEVTCIIGEKRSLKKSKKRILDIYEWSAITCFALAITVAIGLAAILGSW